MSSKINYIIQPQAFEFLRDRIGVILNEELAEQVTLGNTKAEALVVVEGLSVADNTEMTKIMVSLSEGVYANQHQGSATAPYRFFIDCFSNAKSTNVAEGFVIATYKLHSIIGICRHILQDPLYKTLGYVPGFVQRVIVQSIKIGDPDKTDALHSVGGRLTLDVTVAEENGMIEPPLIESNSTIVSINNSNQKLKYDKTF